MRIMLKLAFVAAAVATAAFLLVMLAWFSPPASDVLYGKPLRLDPDDGLAVIVVAILLTPGALSAWLADLFGEARLPRWTRAVLMAICNAIATGALLGAFASLDDYFTAPGWEPAYAMIGALAGAVCGVLQWSLTARLETWRHA